MRLLDANAVSEVTCYAKSTILVYQREGKFPKAKKMGKTARWDSDVVEAWMILAFELKKAIPKIDDDDLKEVKDCVKKLQSLNVGNENKNLAFAQTV